MSARLPLAVVEPEHAGEGVGHLWSPRVRVDYYREGRRLVGVTLRGGVVCFWN